MKYVSLTKYIDTFHPGYSAGTWVVDKEHSGTEDDPIHLPFVNLDQKVMDFMEDFYKSGISVNNYKEVLESAGIAEGLFDFVNLHILSPEVVCAMLTYMIRADRFCEGYLMAGIEHGTVARILKRLKEIDENNPYPDFHVKFVKGQRIADVKTVMLRDMGFPHDLPDRDAEYKTLDQQLISQLEDEFMYLIEELLPRNLQDLFYKVGLEPCHAYWQIYEGAVRKLQIPRVENHNDSDYGKFIGFVEAGIEKLWRKGYSLTEIYECTCATKAMISENSPNHIDRILFEQKDYRYSRGFFVDGVLYDYAVSREDKIVLLIRCVDTEELLASNRDEYELKNYAGANQIPVLIVDTYESLCSDSLGKDIGMALRNPAYVEEYNRRITGEFDVDEFDMENTNDTDECYVAREPVHIGRVKRIKLISNCLCWGPPPEPEDEAEQHLSICSDGRVYFSSYNVGSRIDFKYEKARYERHDISEAKASYLLSTIGSYFEEQYIDCFATDCGSWDIEIINESGDRFQFSGALCSELVYRKEGLSQLLRECIELPELLAFDGNARKEICVGEGEYIFVEVSFENSSKTYCYICDDKLIKEYDEVLVPVGHENNEVVATVESVDVFSAKDAPYPVDKCKHVIRRVIS